MAVQFATRGRLSRDAHVVSACGRIIGGFFIWREIIYLIYSSEAYRTEIEFTSSIVSEIELISSIDSEITLTSSIQSTIEITATIISQYYR